MEGRDYYEVLRLHPSADHEMVVQAYWHLAHKYKIAMARDAFAEHALEELNGAFDVLGAPDLRAEYDSARSQRPATYFDSSEPETKRVSIEVCFWNLPAWQGMLAATSTIALAVVALASGAEPLLVLCLAAAATVAALLTLPDRLLQGGRIPIRKRWKRKLRARELERSTAQIVAHWRETGGHPYAPTSLAELSTSVGCPPRRWREPREDL